MMGKGFPSTSDLSGLRAGCRRQWSGPPINQVMSGSTNIFGNVVIGFGIHAATPMVDFKRWAYR